MNNKKMVTLKDFINSGMIEKSTDIVVSEKYKNGAIAVTTSENISDYLNHEVISIRPLSANAICVNVKSKKDEETKISNVVGKSVYEVLKRIYLADTKTDPSQIKLVLDFKSNTIDLFTFILSKFNKYTIIDDKDEIIDTISKSFKDLIVDNMNIISKFNGTNQVGKTIYTIFINMKEIKNLNVIDCMIKQLSLFDNDPRIHLNIIHSNKE